MATSLAVRIRGISLSSLYVVPVDKLLVSLQADYVNP